MLSSCDPNKKDRRCLDSEKSMGLPLILLVLGEVKYTMILADGMKLSGWDFQVSPGVLEIDFVSESGIGALLIYSTILPRDERRFIGSNHHAQVRDNAE